MPELAGLDEKLYVALARHSDEIIVLAEDLARSLGHAITCPCTQQKACNCGSAEQQANALTEYERLKVKIKEEVINETGKVEAL